MAQDADASNLDLEQILRTLANLSKNEIAPSEFQQQPHNPSQYHDPTDFLAASPYPTQTGISHGYESSLETRISNQHTPLVHPSPVSQYRSSTPAIDPASITEWKHGLRCVNKIAAQNPNFVASIQKQMTDQERNVKDWEAGRQRLTEDHKVKRENEKTHRAVLSIPGLLDDTAPLRTPEREKEELDQYDQKVYRACRLMVESQSTQLKSLGVPFFGMKPFLLLSDHAENAEDEVQADEGASKKITKKQLLELQRKMLTHLLELYGD